MLTEIRTINSDELPVFLSILREAADWLKAMGRGLWTPEMLTEQEILGQYGLDELFLCRMDGEAAGAMILAIEETMHWPDKKPGEAIYLHKLAVKRTYGGTGLSSCMIDFAKKYAQNMHRKYLRLDCDDRKALCTLYERHGFDRVGTHTFSPDLRVVYYQYSI